jgi:hypothetical protein
MNISYEGYEFYGYYIIPLKGDTSYGLVFKSILEPSQSFYFKFLLRKDCTPVDENLLNHESNLSNIFSPSNKINQLVLNMSKKYTVDISILKVSIYVVHMNYFSNSKILFRPGQSNFFAILSYVPTDHMSINQEESIILIPESGPQFPPFLYQGPFLKAPTIISYEVARESALNIRTYGIYFFY